MATMTAKPRVSDWFCVSVLAFGTGANVTLLLVALLANVDRSDMAVATGISYLFRSVWKQRSKECH